ncbi:MgtC/SapB family protein [Tianweitania sp. Rool2]|uniref:Protein MgtC n=2 Tax=Oryzicola mucosus TaxID=2767425 RepID=A0A8J6PFA5_9HYPH|nr:MgtC/SapB family protein [Oryzicola mucosus]
MSELTEAFSHQYVISLPTMIVRLLLAGLLGAIIGFEREWQSRPAGLKTHTMVCIASATFTLLSLELVNVPYFNDQNIQMDPLRLIEAITSGVAFLAAGFIIFAKGEVKGITTGAGMWLASAVGLAAGLGMWEIAVLATILSVSVLLIMRLVQPAVQNAAASDDTDETKS